LRQPFGKTSAANGGTAGASTVFNESTVPVERPMAKNQQAISNEASCGARVAAIAAGTALLWRALGAPPLGPIVLRLGGIALIWHGLAGSSPRARSRSETARIHAKVRDAVQRASEDSFPASDPPSWTPTNGPGSRH
jgi:hypothetical protein